MLRLGDGDAWDAARLVELAQPRDEPESTEEAIRRLGKAEALCGGPFLAEWPFEDWAAARRRSSGRPDGRALPPRRSVDRGGEAP